MFVFIYTENVKNTENYENLTHSGLNRVIIIITLQFLRHF